MKTDYTKVVSIIHNDIKLHFCKVASYFQTTLYYTEPKLQISAFTKFTV